MESREWFRTALQSIDEAVITIDIQGRISFLNTAAEDLLKWPGPNAVAKRVFEVFNQIGEETSTGDAGERQLTGLYPYYHDKIVSVVFCGRGFSSLSSFT